MFGEFEIHDRYQSHSARFEVTLNIGSYPRIFVLIGIGPDDIVKAKHDVILATEVNVSTIGDLKLNIGKFSDFGILTSPFDMGVEVVNATYIEAQCSELYGVASSTTSEIEYGRSFRLGL
jgi:hypothetical protein